MLEAIIQRRSVIKVFLEISQNSQENTCARASFLNKIARLSLFHRAPLVAAFDMQRLKIEALNWTHLLTYMLENDVYC